MKICKGNSYPEYIMLGRNDGICPSYALWLPFNTEVELHGKFTVEELKVIIQFIEEQNDGAHGQRSNS